MKFSPNLPANIQFTSGTTGAPKAAALSHFNMINNARAAQQNGNNAFLMDPTQDHSKGFIWLGRELHTSRTTLPLNYRFIFWHFEGS